MSRASKILARFNAGTGLTFAELVYLAKAFGFVLARQRGSHRAYRHIESSRMLNLQPDGKDAKACQCTSFALSLRKKACDWTSEMPH